MRPLMIHESPSRLFPGDFSAKIAGSVLFLPSSLVAVLEDLGIRNSSQLLALLEAFPSAIADALHWSSPQVRQACDTLKAALEGHVDDVLLRPPPRRGRVYGALYPASVKQRVN